MKSDYYPFGMQMPGRNVLIAGDSYRFGYNGMEMDNEAKGNGNSYTTEFRQYDPRLGRWMSLDPLMGMFPDMSPYVAFDDNPIVFVDPYGLSSEIGGDPIKIPMSGNRQWTDPEAQNNEILNLPDDPAQGMIVTFVYDNAIVEYKYVENQKTGEVDGYWDMHVRKNSGGDFSGPVAFQTVLIAKAEKKELEEQLAEKLKANEFESKAGDDVEKEQAEEKKKEDDKPKEKDPIPNDIKNKWNMSRGGAWGYENDHNDKLYPEVVTKAREGGQSLADLAKEISKYKVNTVAVYMKVGWGENEGFTYFGNMPGLKERAKIMERDARNALISYGIPESVINIRVETAKGSVTFVKITIK